ncbi:O-acetyl-ADP-ribose deacetylase [Bowmanella sp. Y26]|uniref:O-acetyl-ADP-ribose deacetylase n=1 Tax=Bowmanella yangjiangensis TaxID=2811230 RepID=UPI001BDC2729|nr:O-acetyl-ADP-ribose deacetylase [Bowmanella yangjiangensis]MBT1062158.1 O-acetyl-ADP-ribose deacetylase [Bowmanella yangjiangensis]
MAAKITLINEDITTLPVDAIVNAANQSLLGGGGVDGAIHRAAGAQLLACCRDLGGCAVGEAKITPGFNLPARYVIHTVGPIWQDGQHEEARLLAACYRNSLRLAGEYRLSSIAFPAISCGVYGYPINQACKLAVQTVVGVLDDYPQLTKVIFCAFNAEVYQALTAELAVLDLI